MKERKKQLFGYFMLHFRTLIFILIIIVLTRLKLFINSIINVHDKETKVCVCTLGKLENKYIREFVEHYKNYSVDKIFLYDNNDINGEKFEEVINDYIQNGFVKVINFRGKKRPVLRVMNDCYKKNYRIYSWLIFFEVDEFIYLKNYTNIKSYLNDSRFGGCQKIRLNWKFHSDNNLLHYDNRSLKERFPEIIQHLRGKKTWGPLGIKSILKGHIPGVNIHCIHSLNEKLQACDGFGNKKNHSGIVNDVSDLEFYYIDHYYSKSTEEFINKINRGDCFHKDNRMDRIKTYLFANKITNEKINYLENSTLLNLSIFRERAVDK